MKNRLKVMRAENNMTQDGLAKEMEVSRQTINSIETGKYTPSTLLSLKIARFFKVPLEEIFFLEKED
ncbi:MAG: helix-turn-helix transcriptional regulator [Ekhidna sp.]